MGYHTQTESEPLQRNSTKTIYKKPEQLKLDIKPGIGHLADESTWLII